MVIVLYNRRRVFVAASGQDCRILDAALRSQQWSCGWGWLSPGAPVARSDATPLFQHRGTLQVPTFGVTAWWCLSSSACSRVEIPADPCIQ